MLVRVFVYKIKKKIIANFQIFVVIDSIHSEGVECYCQQCVFDFSLAMVVCGEKNLSVRHKKKSVTIHQKNLDVLILTNVTLGPESDFKLYVLKTLQNRQNKTCMKLKIVHITATSFNTYHGYPMIPIKDSFK